ncbi:MAG: hypothetical protein WD512_10770 [Candidatus Paceibacterota bacterium]
MTNEDSLPLNTINDLYRKKSLYKMYRPKHNINDIKNVLFCFQNTQTTRKNCYWVLYVPRDHVSCKLMLLNNSDISESDYIATIPLRINSITVRARNILHKDFIEFGGFSLYERFSSNGLLKIGYEKITPSGVVEFDDRFIDFDKFVSLLYQKIMIRK